MRAVVHDRYGPPEVLRVAEVERPVPKEDEVLVRVHASTVTRSNAIGVRSVEYRFSRLVTGIRRPRRTIFGSEFAGLVRSLGARGVLDRLGEDFTRNGETYDVIFDAVGKQSFRRCRRSLRPGGIYITVDLGFAYHVPLLVLLTRFVGSRRAKLGIGRYRREDLVLIKELVDRGTSGP